MMFHAAILAVSGAPFFPCFQVDSKRILRLGRVTTPCRKVAGSLNGAKIPVRDHFFMNSRMKLLFPVSRFVATKTPIWFEDMIATAAHS